eukprot:Skav217633  [mRNA]  locus=scaffold1334:5610:19402:- [translate_table: standard]
MALNFWHADFKFPSLSLVARIPSRGQAVVLDRLRRIVKAFGSCDEEFSIPSSGRRCTSLIAQLSDLCDFVTWDGLAGASYSRGFSGLDGGFQEFASIPVQSDRAPELTPYFSLTPERLKISGAGQWNPSEFLSDSLWLAFNEPESLRWTDVGRTDDAPDLRKENYHDVLRLMKIWDARGLLHLRDAPLPSEDEDLAMRIFNCRKDQNWDRMIGDRRARNHVEGLVPGASRCLPTAIQLASLEIDPQSQSARVCISDRKDFYHQIGVSRERASSNCLAPLIHRDDLVGSSALADWCRRNLKKSKYDRFAQGDFLGRAPSKKSFAPSGLPEYFQGCFASVCQGDHLGVEFAVDAHRSLLKTYGLLDETQELRNDRAFRGGAVASGLVIDDFFVVSVEDQVPPHAPGEKMSEAFAQLKTATKAYKDYDIWGSPEKDVIDADKAKVVGAELDSSPSTRALGLVTLASPANKRLALAHVSLELAKMRCTSDSLHLCLLGGWIHSLMYRRPMMSLLDHSFKLVKGAEVSKDSPKVIALPRSVAQELCLLAVLSPLMITDLAAKLDPTFYATDASDSHGAIVCAPVQPSLARALWRTGKKKSGYVRMLSRTQAILKKLDPDFDEETIDSAPPDLPQGVPRPHALRFHFIEICGGAGKVSKAVARHGWTVRPVLDLDRSSFYNLGALRLLTWVLNLLEQGLLDSVMVEPPCTTFSPAQYPPSRSYTQPRGFVPDDPKTLNGTTLALRALSIIYAASYFGAPGLLEQPRRTKMKRLQEWIFLVCSGLANEVWTASCMFGSPHQKEFIFLHTNMNAQSLHRKCDHSHSHVKVQGQYTKGSATYVDDLAEAIGLSFHDALCKKLRTAAWTEPCVEGLESPLCNDVMVSSKWRVKSSWRWKRPLHINIKETLSVKALHKSQAISKPGTRQAVALDSNVGLCALVKGRSSSYGLRPALRQTGATVVAGCLYPSYHFSPTRLNMADHPTRDQPLPAPLVSALPEGLPFSGLMDFAELGGLSRVGANWVRLVSVLARGSLAWLGSGDSWRFAHVPYKHHPFAGASAVKDAYSPMDFDSTLGFPGEGPVEFWNSGGGPSLCLLLGILLGFPLFFTLWIWTWGGEDHMDLMASRPLTSTSGSSRFGRRRVLCLLVMTIVCPSGAVSHGSSLQPRDAADRKRAAGRSDLELCEGRPVLGKTQAYRDKLLASFDIWLRVEGSSLENLLEAGEPDIEGINSMLQKYGRSLFKAGRPYGHYAETVNGVASRRPRIRRLLQPAWDLAYAWLREEPPTHHVALPWQVLLSLIVTACYWGWILEAGVIALSWGGLTRIGEVLSATRKHLVLPRDLEFSVDYALLQIDEPKTRYRAARHQAARLDHPQLLKVIDVAFGRLLPEQSLWPFSGQTMRTRFQKLLAANRLDQLPRGLSKGLDLGSLRAGGASWLMSVSEDSELTRRRGRWLTCKVMEIYVQEVASIQFLPHLPATTKELIIEVGATPLEKFENGLEADPKDIKVDEWKEGTLIVVTRGVYWEEEVRIAGVIRGLLMDGGLTMLRVDLQGSTSEALVRWKGAHPGKLLEVDLCKDGCINLSRDGLVHCTRIKKFVEADREGWEDNLLAVRGEEDQLAALRARAEAVPGGEGAAPKAKTKKDSSGSSQGSGKEKKKKKKKKKKKEGKVKVSGTKTAEALFAATGLDPKPQVRKDLRKRARKLTKKKGARGSGSSDSSSSSTQSDRNLEEQTHLFGEEVRVKQVWKSYPGILTLSAAEMMQNTVVQQSGHPWNLEAGVVPPIFSQYWRLCLHHRMGGPLSRECQTLCYVLDLLLQGRAAAASDVLTQRLKSLEQIGNGGHYTVAQRQELVPLEATTISSPTETMEASRVMREEVKAKEAASSSWRRPEWPKRDETKGKSKGKEPKGKGKTKWESSKGNKEDDKTKKDK